TDDIDIMGIRGLHTYLHSQHPPTLTDLLDPTIAEGKVLLIDADALLHIFINLPDPFWDKTANIALSVLTGGQYLEIAHRVKYFFECLVNVGRYKSIVAFFGGTVDPERREVWKSRRTEDLRQHEASWRLLGINNARTTCSPENIRRQPPISVRAVVQRAAADLIRENDRWEEDGTLKVAMATQTPDKQIANYARRVMDAGENELLGIISRDSNFAAYCSILNTTWFILPDVYPPDLLPPTNNNNPKMLMSSFTPSILEQAFQGIHGNATLLGLLSVVAGNETIDVSTQNSIRYNLFHSRRLPHFENYIQLLSKPNAMDNICSIFDTRQLRFIQDLFKNAESKYDLSESPPTQPLLDSRVNELPESLRDLYQRGEIGRNIVAILLNKDISLGASAELADMKLGSGDYIRPLYRNLYWVLFGRQEMVDEWVYIVEPTHLVVEVEQCDFLKPLTELVGKNAGERRKNLARCCFRGGDAVNGDVLFQKVYDETKILSDLGLTNDTITNLQLLALSFNVLSRPAPVEPHLMDTFLFVLLVNTLPSMRSIFFAQNPNLVDDPTSLPRAQIPIARKPSMYDLSPYLIHLSTLYLRTVSTISILYDANLKPSFEGGRASVGVLAFDGFMLHQVNRRMGRAMKKEGGDGFEVLVRELVGRDELARKLMESVGRWVKKRKGFGDAAEKLEARKIKVQRPHRNLEVMLPTSNLIPILGAAIALLLPSPASALENGLGRTPAMGWNSWNLFACAINETLIRQTADVLASSGLVKLGYKYLNIDDCWQVSRTETGEIVEDREAFPSGMKALAEYVQSKGLKFGIYSSAGTLTCAERPGSLYYELLDAKTYASWKVDYLKYDNCFNKGLVSKRGTVQRYGDMRDALNATGRPMLYSLCNWGEAYVWEYGKELGNSWRTTGDICDSYEGYWCSAMAILDYNVPLTPYSAPGGFNDLDMLEVGNGGMSYDEYLSHFSAWAALKSPLLLGNDIRHMEKKYFDMVTNKEVIAINQDPLGVSASLMSRTKDIDIWAGPLANGDRVVVVLNQGAKSESVEVPVGILGDGVAGESEFKVNVRDIWAKKNFEATDKIVFENIASHGVAMARVSSKRPFGKFIPVNPNSFKDRRNRWFMSPQSYEASMKTVPYFVGGWILLVISLFFVLNGGSKKEAGVSETTPLLRGGQ
ncbi:hypothetical protein HDV05_005564, partial [Chytridiales sp. JEL 0842]